MAKAGCFSRERTAARLPGAPLPAWVGGPGAGEFGVSE